MKIVIIGNGISGISAARWLRKLSDHEIIVISGESEYFFSRTALMYIYMGHMRQKDTQPYEPHFWDKNRIQLLQAWVREVDFEAKELQLEDARPQEQKDAHPTPSSLVYDQLIIATGSSPNKFGWPGQDLKGVGSLYSLQDLDYMEHYSKNLERAVIVGGGLIGLEMAEMFHSRHIPTTFLVREQSYWDNVLPFEESQMVNRHIQEHDIDLRLGTELREIVDDGQGRACAVLTTTGERIDCGFVGLTAGVHPNVAFLRDTPLAIKRGVLVDKHLKTNMPDVYAIGDCAELLQPQTGRRAIEAVWYTGRMMGEVAARHICENEVEYHPGLWFNSAKFFDIEYQVYGDIQAQPLGHSAHLYWQHPGGKKSIRLAYHRAKGHLLGVQVMGIRYRQEVCTRWIEAQSHIEQVLEQLPLANFDPEFYPQHEQELLDLYHQQTGKSLHLKKKKSLGQVLSFLKRSMP